MTCPDRHHPNRPLRRFRERRISSSVIILSCSAPSRSGPPLDEGRVLARSPRAGPGVRRLQPAYRVDTAPRGIRLPASPGDSGLTDVRPAVGSPVGSPVKLSSSPRQDLAKVKRRACSQRAGPGSIGEYPRVAAAGSQEGDLLRRLDAANPTICARGRLETSPSGPLSSSSARPLRGIVRGMRSPFL